jgi:hypothetical protein
MNSTCEPCRVWLGGSTGFASAPCTTREDERTSVEVALLLRLERGCSLYVSVSTPSDDTASLSTETASLRRARRREPLRELADSVMLHPPLC